MCEIAAHGRMLSISVSFSVSLCKLMDGAGVCTSEATGSSYPDRMQVGKMYVCKCETRVSSSTLSLFSIGHLLKDLSSFSSDRNNTWPIFLITDLSTAQNGEGETGRA